MLAAEVPVTRQRAFLQDLLDSGVDAAHYKIPTTLPTDDSAIQKLIVSILSSTKGAGWSARLLEQCQPNERPTTAVEFLKKIYTYFPLPVITQAAGTPKQTP
jgi:putative ATP-dependent endonuclease of OLD family